MTITSKQNLERAWRIAKGYEVGQTQGDVLMEVRFSSPEKGRLGLLGRGFRVRNVEEVLV